MHGVIKYSREVWVDAVCIGYLEFGRKIGIQFEANVYLHRQAEVRKGCCGSCTQHTRLSDPCTHHKALLFKSLAALKSQSGCSESSCPCTWHQFIGLLSQLEHLWQMTQLCYCDA